MTEKGRMSVQKTKKGFACVIVINGKRMPAPSCYVFKDTDLNEAECDVERDNGQIIRITVKGKEPERKEDTNNKNKPGQNPSQPQGRTNSAENLYSISNTKIPKDTRDALNGKLNDIDNFYLKLNRTANFLTTDSKEKPVLYKAEDDNKHTGKKEKYDLGLSLKIACSIIGSLRSRQKDLASRLCSSNIKTAVFSPDWRLIVGIGNESVYEVSITLHHIYGTPYIPGQAAKGVTRSWIITELFGQDEGKALKDKLFCHIFGSPKESAIKEHQGSVIFFDAFPVAVPMLEVDIMNPHYSEYYQGTKPPADYINLVPIPFLTVAKNNEFEFITGSKKTLKAADVLPEGKTSPIVSEGGLNGTSTLLDIACSWLKKALTEHGIGAKTAVGYGYFSQK